MHAYLNPLLLVGSAAIQVVAVVPSVSAADLALTAGEADCGPSP